MPSPSTYDKKHNANQQALEQQIRRQYLKVVKSAASLSKKANLNRNDEFFFRGNPAVNKEINKLLTTLYDNVLSTTISGINSEWDLAVQKNNDTAYQVYGKQLEELPRKTVTDILSTNGAARQAFVERKIEDLRLSERVWRNTMQFKQELELALEQGINQGASAGRIAKDIQQYLQDPDKLFRRVRDDKGVLRLSKAAKAYHPGRGRYRSSYKNAVRLARNETNFAYERSNHLKMQQQDFVVGMEILVSPSHNPEDDKGGIKCIELQGKYPKEFDFTMKWHVNCKCYTVAILKTREERDEDLRRIMNGEEPLPPETSKNYVGTVPPQFVNTYNENKEKWSRYSRFPMTFEKNIGLLTEQEEEFPTKEPPVLLRNATTVLDGEELYRGDIKDKGESFSDAASTKDYVLDGGAKNKANFHWFTTRRAFAEKYATEQVSDLRGVLEKSIITTVKTTKVQILDFKKMQLTDQVAFMRNLYDSKLPEMMANQSRLPILKSGEIITEKQLDKILGYRTFGNILNNGQAYSDGDFGVLFKGWLIENGYDGYTFQTYQYGDEVAIVSAKKFKLVSRESIKK